jgi:hypothetical protein
MSDAVTIAMITALASLPPSIVGIAAAYFSYRASVNSRTAVIISKKTEENTNHLKDELVALTAKASHAEGMKAAEDIAKKETIT